MAPLTKYEKAKLPESQIRNDGALSRTFLAPQYGIVQRGRKGKLTREELRMPGDQATELCSAKFEELWAEEIAKAKAAGKEPSLLRAIVRAFVSHRFSEQCASGGNSSAPSVPVRFTAHARTLTIACATSLTWTQGWEIFWAGVWKCIWSIFVILGASICAQGWLAMGGQRSVSQLA